MPTSCLRTLAPHQLVSPMSGLSASARTFAFSAAACPGNRSVHLVLHGLEEGQVFRAIKVENNLERDRHGQPRAPSHPPCQTNAPQTSAYDPSPPSAPAESGRSTSKLSGRRSRPMERNVGRHKRLPNTDNRKHEKQNTERCNEGMQRDPEQPEPHDVEPREAFFSLPVSAPFEFDYVAAMNYVL